MSRIIRGTRSAGGQVIHKGGQGGTRKITCPGCHGIATPQQQGDGTTLLVCPCGKKFKITKM